MFRKLVLTALVATGTLGGLALTPAAASAHPPADHDRRDDRDRFQVLVRHRGHWDVYGTYRDRDDAYRVARQLERRGADARVERVRGR